MVEETEKFILDSIKDYLENGDTLRSLRGQTRAAVTSILSKNSKSFVPPEAPDEVKLINELIREYLAWNGYNNSEKVLSDEAGQSTERLGRDLLSSKLNVMDDGRTVKIPLMYYIVSAFQKTGDKNSNKK